MLSCKDATRLMSEAQDRQLGVGERIQLEMHLAMCKGCRNFQAQMAFLRQACRSYMGRPAKPDDDEKKGQ